ncbi:hypothetical protein RT99_04275 [Flavobacterium sp. MEB061]|nr:hypothetical protein RT99_04275 [Flavobacterium sp. MEB061]
MRTDKLKMQSQETSHSGSAASGGETNPFKWNSSTWISALSGTASSVASYNATTGLNSYTDNYNNKPALGASATGQWNYVNSFLNSKDNSFDFKQANNITSQRSLIDKYSDSTEETFAESQFGKGGQSFGFGASSALGGGIGYEVGIVTDNNGGRAFYLTFKGNIGFGSDVGVSVANITPTTKRDFSVNDFSGKGNSYNGSYGAWGYERGGTMSKSGVEKLYPNNAGSGKNGYITNAGSRSYLLPMLRGGLGLFFSESQTWTFNF